MDEQRMDGDKKLEKKISEMKEDLKKEIASVITRGRKIW